MRRTALGVFGVEISDSRVLGTHTQYDPNRGDNVFVTAPPGGLRSYGVRGWVVLVCALGLVVSCSGTSEVSPIGSAAQDEPPSTRVFLTRLEVTWSVGVDEAPAVPDDRMLYLAPASPVEGVDTDAVLRRTDTVGVGIRDYDYTVALKWPTGGLSVSASPAMSCYVTPDGATWESVEIRDVQGCEWTNEAGLYFAKWTEGATNFKYESFDITGAEAREMLAGWDRLE